MSYLKSKIVVFIINLITKGPERSVKAKKNILAALLIRGGSIATGLILVPLTIHYVNPTQYGIWITLSSIIGWFSFFDIGFGNGLRNKFAESIAKGDHELARIYVSTTYAILSIIIAVVLLVFFCINPILNWSKILNAPANMIKELRILALIVFVFFCMQFVLKLLTTVLTANQQPAKASFFSFLGSLFSLVVIYILTKTTSGNLIYLGLSLGFMPVLVLTFSSFWFYTQDYRKYAPSFKYIQFGFARNLISLGIKFFIIQVAAVILFQTSNLIIAQLFGPLQVTPYNVAYKYFSIITMSMGIIMIPFWSAFTDAWVKKDIQWIKNTMKKLKLIWVLFSIASIIMLFFSNFIYRLWIGKEIVVPFSVSLVLTAFVIINAWNGIYANFLNGVGIIRLQLYSSILGIVFNIPMAIYFGRTIGVSGVILSTVILGGINMIWTIIQYNKIINFRAKGLWAK